MADAVLKFPTTKAFIGAPLVADFALIAHQLPEDQRRQWSVLEGSEFDPERVAAQLAVRVGPRWALTDPAGERALMIGGFRWLAPGVWEGWDISLEIAWTMHADAVARGYRRVVHALLERDAHRLQVSCLAERKQAREFYRAQGFKAEGLLTCYGPNGEEVAIYGRIRT